MLINNAGVIPRQRETTVDGLEMQFAVNHLAYFLLTNLLLDPLTAGAPARVVNVRRARTRAARWTSTDLQSERRYDPVRVYGRDQARQRAVHLRAGAPARPDRRDRQLSPPRRDRHQAAGRLHERAAGGRCRRAHLRGSPEKGAETMVYLAASPEVGRRDRPLLRRPAREPVVAGVLRRNAAARLWEESARLTALVPRRHTLTARGRAANLRHAHLRLSLFRLRHRVRAAWSAQDTKVACPYCQGRKLERLMSLTARPAGAGKPADYSRLGPPPGGGCCGGGCHSHNH